MTRLLEHLNRPVAQRLGWTLVGLSLVVGVVGGINGGLKDRPDWRSFYHETCAAWRDRAIDPATKMFGYPPGMFVVLCPFTAWSPQPLGMIAFMAVNVAAACVSGWVLYRWWYVDAGLAGGRGYVWVLALTCVHVAHVLRANQLTLWVLVLCVVGLTLLMHRREWSGGFVLGLAACVKVMPGVFIVYLLLRRSWRGAAAMVLALVLCEVVPAITCFGWDGAIREHRAWLRRAEWYSNERLIEAPYLRIRRHGHNCAYSLVLARWLRPPPDAPYQRVLHGEPPEEVIEATHASLRPDEYLLLDPRPTPDKPWEQRRVEIPPTPQFRLAHASATTVRVVWMLTLGAMVLTLSAATWRRRRTPAGGTGWRAEAALWLLLMFWPTPMMRDYYLALAIPACVVVWEMVIKRAGKGDAASVRGLWPARLGLGLCLLSVFSLDWEAANFYGIHMAAAAGLAFACGWVWRQECLQERGHGIVNEPAVPEAM